MVSPPVVIIVSLTAIASFTVPTFSFGIAARLLRPEEALTLLAESFAEGQTFMLRSRLHAFTDWQPLRAHPAFVRIVTPQG